MRRTLLISFGLIAAAALAIWLIGPNKLGLVNEAGAPPPHINNSTPTAESPKGAAAQPDTVSSARPVPDSGVQSIGEKAFADQQSRQTENWERWRSQWEKPIEFYGKVLDEGGAPIPQASVRFEWTDAHGGASKSETSSDGDGSFSLAGVKSRGLSVHVSKSGYYTSSRQNETYFLYADITGRGTFSPDPANPVVFRLRKRGPGVDLITSQHGVKSYFGVVAPIDGLPVHVDLLTQSTGSGALTISQTKPPPGNWKAATNWTFRMELPDGGFARQNDEFPFEAPETGYSPVLDFGFDKGQTNWATELHKDYYIRFGSPPKYGRLHLDTSIDMAGARLTYAVNPDGSRYLEGK